MKIDELLNKYFDGETSCEEESQIRRYFSEETVPEHLLCYKPMFAYFDKEIVKERSKRRIIPRRKIIMYTLSGIAACAIIAIAMNTFLHSPAEPCTGNYAIINGKCCTDEATIKAYAKASFKDVATSKDEVFSELFND